MLSLQSEHRIPAGSKKDEVLAFQASLALASRDRLRPCHLRRSCRIDSDSGKRDAESEPGPQVGRTTRRAPQAVGRPWDWTHLTLPSSTSISSNTGPSTKAKSGRRILTFSSRTSRPPGRTPATPRRSSKRRSFSRFRSNSSPTNGRPATSRFAARTSGHASTRDSSKGRNSLPRPITASRTARKSPTSPYSARSTSIKACPRGVGTEPRT